ncbi:MAG: efflux RND transporter periplasmic adaptor subunit [Xanthomonadales bacterium]|nr:efflux RND transporter periplasmic adaptor subunit [Xanthomonadales bacterium]
MNKTRILIVISIAVAALVGAAAGWWLSPALTGKADNGAERGQDEREVLYWVAPMDPDFRRDKPGKSPMGMDLVPVYADGKEAGDAGQPSLRINPTVVNNIGVKTAPVQRGTLHRRIETVGYITPDADLVEHVHVRAEGWIEELAADTEGDRVEAGQLLFRIYSPALVSAQDEYLQGLRMAQSTLIRATETRLRALGMKDDQIEALKSRGKAQQLFDVRSPLDGYVMELNVRQGMFVQPGTTIMSLANLTTVWVDVDVFENQIGWVEIGQTARMRLPFAPDREWVGEVEYVYPKIRPESRTARIRLAFENPDLALKPNMYAQVAVAGAPRRDVAYVPSQAVIRTGANERVILALGEGRFRPAQVRTGLESEGRVEILEGLSAGEKVVISSQFLIDSEASLDASLLRMINEGTDPGRTPEAFEMQQDAGDVSAPSDNGMEGMNHADDEMDAMDHSGHDMETMQRGGESS